MTRIYLKLLTGIAVAIGCMVLMTPILGQLRPANPVLQGMVQSCEDQPQPCWYGIQPGITPIEAALTAVNATPFTTMTWYEQVLVLVYENDSTRCGVEIYPNNGVVEKLVILNCFDKQVGNVIEAMHNSSRQLPVSLGMMERLMSDEAGMSTASPTACLSFTPYGQIIGMPLTLSYEEPVSAPAGWRDYLPYGWYVHHGGGLSCDVVSLPVFGTG